jgi:hypothetical protein
VEKLIQIVQKGGSAAALLFLLNLFNLYDLPVPGHWPLKSVVALKFLACGAGACLDLLWTPRTKWKKFAIFVFFLILAFLMPFLYNQLISKPPTPEGLGFHKAELGITYFLSYISFGFCAGQVVSLLFKQFGSKKKK